MAKNMTLFDRHPGLVVVGILLVLVIVSKIFGLGSGLFIGIFGLLFGAVFIVLIAGFFQELRNINRLRRAPSKNLGQVSSGYFLFSVKAPKIGTSIIDKRDFAWRELTLNRYAGGNKTYRNLIESYESTTPPAFVRVSDETSQAFVPTNNAQIDVPKNQIRDVSLDVRQSLVDQDLFGPEILAGDRWILTERILASDKKLTILGHLSELQSDQIPGSAAWARDLTKKAKGNASTGKSYWSNFKLDREDRQEWQAEMRSIEKIGVEEKPSGDVTVRILTPDYSDKPRRPLVISDFGKSKLVDYQYGALWTYIGGAIIVLIVAAALFFKH